MMSDEWCTVTPLWGWGRNFVRHKNRRKWDKNTPSVFTFTFYKKTPL
jgi:hypothetical protein